MGFEKVAEVWRGAVVESVHFGVAAVANADGEIVHGWGDPSVVTYPRSALKPIQAIALVETGAHRAYRLEERHLALACASHLGEPMHVDLVERWLETLGLSEQALACGPDYPIDVDAAHALIRAGRDKSRLYHNCSGKHCGFLTVARHMGWDVAGYGERDHPAQRRYLDSLSELLGRDARALDFGVDSCTLPAAALSVGDAAVVMARFAAARVDLARPQGGDTGHPRGRAGPSPLHVGDRPAQRAPGRGHRRPRPHEGGCRGLPRRIRARPGARHRPQDRRRQSARARGRVPRPARRVEPPRRRRRAPAGRHVRGSGGRQHGQDRRARSPVPAIGPDRHHPRSGNIERRHSAMKARIKWIEGRMFLGESGSGHAVALGRSGRPDNPSTCPSPMELILIGLGGCTAFDVVHILEKSREPIDDCVAELDAERA
ncbi:MAG: asparaginase, partial [Proteobacteria bacterium]|nr:asparaginase [Pseudomonadota bacterium]